MLPRMASSPSSPTKSSLPSLPINTPPLRGFSAGTRRRRLLTVIARSRFSDEERNSRSGDVVEANLDVLRERIEAVQIKERLELTCSTVLRSASLRMMTGPPSTSATCGGVKGLNNNNQGWNYYGGARLVTKSRRPSHDRTFELVYDLYRLVALVSSTVGATCLSGAFLLYLVSILTHHFSHQF